MFKFIKRNWFESFFTALLIAWWGYGSFLGIRENGETHQLQMLPYYQGFIVTLFLTFIGFILMGLAPIEGKAKIVGQENVASGLNIIAICARTIFKAPVAMCIGTLLPFGWTSVCMLLGLWVFSMVFYIKLADELITRYAPRESTAWPVSHGEVGGRLWLPTSQRIIIIFLPVLYRVFMN